jgi:SAM-dependent methyltransferase
MTTRPPAKRALHAQRRQWEGMLATHPDMFGSDPSYAAGQAAAFFTREGKTHILELGGGQGRDSLFFARQGFHVQVLDYSESGVRAIAERARAAGLTEALTAIHHDVRQPLPFADETFDGCYSHMLYCMALTTAELERLSEEIGRVLKPGGVNIYTARNASDAHYRQGIHRGEDLYEVDGFTVHFFGPEKIEHLAKGYAMISVEEFEEGELPRRLSLVTMRKPEAS